MGFLWALLGLLLHVWPGVIAPAHAQGSRKDDIVFNSRGIPLAGATVRVCAMPASGQPCTPLALIYSDAALTQALANPTTTDGLGNYFFYAAPGKYEIEISGPGITTKQLPNIILPNDPSSPTFSGISAFSLNLSGNLTVNGNTTVVGNLASGTLNLANQSTPPGAASSGTINLYTKTADKLLYYKDDTGTETGPLGPGAQTNVTNNWSAQQNWNANARFKGPNPYVDVTAYNVRAIQATATPAVSGITATISNGSTSATVSTASCPIQTGSVCFQNGDGVVILGAGAAQSMTTPSAPTVQPSVARVMTGTGDVVNAPAGSASYSYVISACDKGGGCTAASATGSTATGSAALGSQSVTLTSCSRSSATVTCTTSGAHGLAVGTGILINSSNGLSDTSFSGWYQVATVPDNTHFTFTSGQTTANGASASATGGTVFWWNCNHISWSTVAGAYRYFVWNTTSTPKLVAVSKPINLTNNGFTSGTLSVDDFGSPMMDNLTSVPPYISTTTPPASATNDSLVTTITSGAGTTTLTLANTASNSVTNATILFDNEPNIKAAGVVAQQSYPLYFPIPVAGSGSYVVNSFLDWSGISPAMIVPGGVTFNDTMFAVGKLLGDPMPTYGGSGGQFVIELSAGVACRVIPCIHQIAGGLVRGITFSGGSNQIIDVLNDGGGGGGGTTFDRVNFSGQGSSADYMSIPLYTRGQSGQASAVSHLRRVTFNVGPNQVDGLTATPVWFCDDCGTTIVDEVFINRRGMLWKGDPAGMPVSLKWGYVQGGIVPFITTQGAGGINANIEQVVEDTTGHSLVANLPGAGNQCVNVRVLNAGSPSNGMPLITGNALCSLNGSTSGQNTAAISGSNFTDNNVHVNGAGSFDYDSPVPAVPSAAVSSGGSVSVGVHNYQMTWVDAFGLESQASPRVSATTTTGNQTVTITPPAAPANSGIVGYFIYRDSLKFVASGLCTTPTQTGTNYVDTGGIICTTSGGPPQFPGGGIVDIGSGGVASPFLKLPGTVGSAPGAAATLSPTLYTANRTQTFPDVTGIVPVSSYLNSAYDNATRANGAIDPNWTIQQNGLNIASNQIQGTTAAASNTASWNANLFSPVQFAQVTITALNGASDFPGVTVLASGTGSASTYYDCVENSTTIFMQRVVNSGTTNLTSTSSTGAVGDILRLEVAPGGALTCYKNGVVTLTATDTQITAGSPGLLISGNVATEKNWSGGNLHPLAQVDTEQDWTRTQHFVQGIALGGSASESFNNIPRAEQNVFLPGALTSTWTGATWTTDKAVTVTRVQVQAKTAPSGCTTNAVVRLTDGTTPVNVTISTAANDSGAISQNYAAGAALTVAVQTAAAGCTTSPADANVVVQYRMQ